MMTTEQIKHRLADSNLLAVSRGSGVSYETIRKLAKGKAENVRYSSVRLVIEYLESKENV